MKIQSLTITNIKSFKEERQIIFTNDLNILIGPNAGGKSNLLEILQALINDLILLNVNISKNSENKEKVIPYKYESLQSNRSQVFSEVLDKYVGQETVSSVVNLKLLIEESDIQNIETIRKVKDQLLDYESRSFVGTTIRDALNRVDYGLNFQTLIGQILEITIRDQSLDEPSDVDGKPYRQFFYFLQASNLVSNFIRLFNTDTNSNVLLKPYFLYISPHRNPIDLSSREIRIDLVNDRYDISFLKQTNQTQSTQIDVWTMLLRRLVENQHDGNTGDNDYFRRLLGDILGLDFSITQVEPLKRSITYSVKFFRKLGVGSPKLSSGEKEFLNLIVWVYIHQIKDGTILMDEPELHLHPRLQKELLNYYLSLSAEKNLQIILVTHSTHLIVPEILKNVIRIYKKDQISNILLPNIKMLEETTAKNTFRVVHATNNEKIFFADKVILVEGDIDKIIYESTLKLIQLERNNKEIIEVLNVLGKNSFVSHKNFLSIWDIPSFIIADNDYIIEVGNDEIKTMIGTSFKKVRESIQEKHGRDAATLLGSLERITHSALSEITQEDFEALKSLWVHIKSRHLQLPEVLTAEQKSHINNFIAQLYPTGQFILKEGEIEDYFGLSRDSDIQEAIDKAILISQGSFLIPDEIRNIFTQILS